ncbi:hypothetical protein RYX36_027157 [Vicia faba]
MPAILSTELSQNYFTSTVHSSKWNGNYRREATLSLRCVAGRMSSGGGKMKQLGGGTENSYGQKRIETEGKRWMVCGYQRLTRERGR